MTTSTTLPVTACPEWCNRDHLSTTPRSVVVHEADTLTVYCDLDDDQSDPPWAASAGPRSA